MAPRGTPVGGRARLGVVPLDETVNLDLQQAFTQIQELVDRLQSAGREGAAAISEEIASAVGTGAIEVPVTVADPGALADEIAAATGEMQEVPVSIADPGALTDEIAGAVGEEQSVPVSVADPGSITDEIAGAVGVDQAFPVSIENLSELADAIAGAINSQIYEVAAQLANADELAAEVTDAINAGGDNASPSPSPSPGPGPEPGQHSSEGLGAFEKAALGAEVAAGGAQGKVGGLNKVLSETGPEAAAAGAGILAVAEITKEMVHEGAIAEQSLALFKSTFGSLGEEFERFNLNGVNASLDELTLKLGSDDKAILGTVSRLALLGRQTGATDEEIIHTAQQFTILAARAVTLNPSLGSINDVMQRMPLALSRGGRFAQGFGINLTQAQIAAEALAEGIQKPVSAMSIYEKATLGAQVATKQLGDHIGTDIEAGTNLGIFKLRAFREEIRRSLETQGLDLVQPIASAVAPIIPVITNIAGIVGRAVLAVAPLLEVIGKNVFGPLATSLHLVQVVIEPLIPILKLVAVTFDLILSPVTLLFDQLEKLVTVVQDALPGAFNFLGREAAKALLPIIDIINSIIGAFNRIADHIPGLDSIKKINTSGIQAYADNAQTAAQRTEDWKNKIQTLGGEMPATTEAVDSAADATARLAEQQKEAADSIPGGTGQFSDLAKGVEEFNATLLKSRGLTDDAFFALQKLGDRGPAALLLLTQSFSKGGLSLSEFQNTADGLGLSLGELAAIEAKARQETEDFKSGVSKAIGDITEATKELDDKGKANIQDFVNEIAQQALDAAAFSNSIQTLFARGADELANALLAAGPAAAGAARQAAESTDSQLASFENLATTSKKSFAESKEAIDGYAAAATQDAGQIKTAFSEGGPDPGALSDDVDTALLNAQNALDSGKDAAIVTATAVGEALVTGVAQGMRNAQGEVNQAAQDTIDGALLAAQSHAQVGSPSRLFSREIGIPIDEGIADGIRKGFFAVDDAIGDVIAGLQRSAETELGNVFDALHAGQALQGAQSKLGQIQQARADLIQHQADLANDVKSLNAQIAAESIASAAITAREQQTIEQAQRTLDDLKRQAADQAALPDQLAQAQRVAALEGSDLNDIRSRLATETASVLLGTGNQDLVNQLKADLTERQRAFDDAAKNVEDLTSKLNDQKVSAADLQVAAENLAQAQQDATGPTQALKDLQNQLTQAQKDQVDVAKQLADGSNDVADAQLAVEEAYARAAKAGDIFFKQGDHGQDVLRAIGDAAGFSSGQIQNLIDKYGNFSVLVSQSVGGAGAPNGTALTGATAPANPKLGSTLVDIFGDGVKRTPADALALLNFIRGNAGQSQFTSLGQAAQVTGHTFNIYQANDPTVLAGTISAITGLQGVR